MTSPHPSVIFINAITSFPQHSEQRCYPDEAAAWDDLVSYQPFNNTMVRAARCKDVHCPHGCTTPGPRVSPVVCAVVLAAVDGRSRSPRRVPPGLPPLGRTIAPDGRFKCPKCRSEFTPGQPPDPTCTDCGALLVPGIDEEAAQWRTADRGRYFCPVAADALHHPAITA
jgi:hypothetical protein